MRLLVSGSVVAAAAIVMAPAASHATTEPSFAGSCTFAGTEMFTPPLALAGRPGHAAVTASGRCSGTLVDSDGHARVVVGSPASYHQTTAAPSVSCIGGQTRGVGVLTIGTTPLEFAVAEPQLTVLSTLSYTAPAWTGFGFASVAPTANPLTLALACAGTGITTVPVILTARLHRR